jgi:hypothetical protein
MKKHLEAIFQPLLQGLESGEDSYDYRPIHRKILIVVGVLFFVLAGVALYFSLALGELFGLLSTLVFASVSGLCLVVGALGSDRAVARIWGSR